MDKLKILSLGAGVQSTTVLMLSCLGRLPKIDCAIFADTGWEPQPVYEHLNWLTDYAKNYAIPIHRVSSSNIRVDALRSQVRGRKIDGKRWVSMPFRTLDIRGNRGMIRRQCTREYKIDPIDQFIRRELLGLKKGQRAPKDHIIDQWFGISVDEAQRMRDSPVKYKRYVYPLIGIPEEYGLSWTRRDCNKWLKEQLPDKNVPRSACVGCPYRTNQEWRWLRDNSPFDWEDVIEFDKRIRKCGGTRGDMFIHRDCVPLSATNLDTNHTLCLFGEECDGLCGT